MQPRHASVISLSGRAPGHRHENLPLLDQHLAHARRGHNSITGGEQSTQQKHNTHTYIYTHTRQETTAEAMRSKGFSSFLSQKFTKQTYCCDPQVKTQDMTMMWTPVPSRHVYRGPGHFGSARQLHGQQSGPADQGRLRWWTKVQKQDGRASFNLEIEGPHFLDSYLPHGAKDGRAGHMGEKPRC